MNVQNHRKYASHGSGRFELTDFRAVGKNVIFEQGVLVFHPENITIGDNVYIGHNAILKGYYRNQMVIGDHTWIGQSCFLHSGGGIRIGRAVGIGPAVKILTSVHKEGEHSEPVIFNELEFSEVVVEDGCDLGVGAIILPGVRIGEGSIVAAGAVVSKNVPPYCVVGGVPGRILRRREKT